MSRCSTCELLAAMLVAAIISYALVSWQHAEDNRIIGDRIEKATRDMKLLDDKGEPIDGRQCIRSSDDG